MPSTPFKLVDNLIAIRREKPPAISDGGIALPDGANEPSTPTGEVVAVGPGMFYPEINGRVPCQVAVGDKVIVSRAARVRIDGEELSVARDSDVIAVFPKK